VNLCFSLRWPDAEVMAAGSGEEALKLVEQDRPDFILLDINLPGMDGFQVCQEIRSFTDVPIVMLSARDSEVDKVRGLEMGADDYITKPFRPRELVARIKTVLRRTGAPSRETTDRLLFPGLVIDVDAREVRRAGREVALSTLEFDLLVALARAPGRVLSRRQLLETVWGFDFFGDERVVDVHIRSIRKELGDSAEDPELIGTVRGVGYKFIGIPE
jgi:DNA-binding response OmpR family regulator